MYDTSDLTPEELAAFTARRKRRALLGVTFVLSGGVLFSLGMNWHNIIGSIFCLVGGALSLFGYLEYVPWLRFYARVWSFFFGVMGGYAYPKARVHKMPLGKKLIWYDILDF